MFIENSIQRHICDWIKEKISPSDSILELGFGDGLVTEILSASSSDYTVIEGSEKICQIAANKFNNIDIVHTLFEEFTPKKKYDIIIAGHVLEHVKKPVDLLSKIKKWIKPSGHLIVVVPNAESIHRELAVIMGLQKKNSDLSARDHQVGHIRVYNLEGLKNDVDAAGWKVEEERGFFLKVLPNSMMLEYSPDLIQAMNLVSKNLRPQDTANLALYLKTE